MPKAIDKYTTNFLLFLTDKFFISSIVERDWLMLLFVFLIWNSSETESGKPKKSISWKQQASMAPLVLAIIANNLEDVLKINCSELVDLVESGKFLTDEKNCVKTILKVLKDDFKENKIDPNYMDYFDKYYTPAFTYKALNRLIQGSAADMTKKAMVDLYEKGIIPHIQIHDELCFSTTDHESEMIRETMEQTIPLEVKNKVDYESGPNWGTIKWG